MEMFRAKSLWVVPAILLATGCSTIGTTFGGPAGGWQEMCIKSPKPVFFYTGVRCDLNVVESEWPYSLGWLAAVDLPLSLVADTLVLPWTTYKALTDRPRR